MTRHAGTRLAVPGPVWGERPRRAEPAAGADAPVRAPQRGAPASGLAGALADWRARRRGADAGTVARRAREVAARLSAVPGQEDACVQVKAVPGLHAGAAPGLHAAVAGLAREGLAPAALALALGTAGAALARATGLVPRDNQYRCAALLLAERLVELDTGEGKSVAVALAAGVAALTGAPVHVLTANDYLAARDAEAFAGFFGALGLRVAPVAESMDEDARRAGWDTDVVYATARVLGFDELRDGLNAGSPPLLARGLCVGILDEADAILLDEARTPLIVAEGRPDPAQRARAWQALDLAGRLSTATDAVLDPASGSARLTAAGHAALEALARADGAADGLDARLRTELVEQALVALHLLRRDVHYVVQDREVVLVDATTGRPSPGRVLSRALHTLVALKERVSVPPATHVRASVTYPRLMSRYHHLCGTSGTLREAAGELRAAYGLGVLRVERTHGSALRLAPARLFANRDAQFDAAIARATRLAGRGRCVLVATDSVADSAALAARFEALGVAVVVLDARHDRNEHARIERAGDAGRITVATQMAGRGTDIRLSPEAARAGGLHVLSLQHNRSARIDRQVIGRAARQTDPGSAERWLRLDDSPLEPGRLPSALAALVPALALLAERTGTAAPALAGSGRGRARLVDAMWCGCQRWWRWEDRLMRTEALGHDRLWSRRLHFATVVGIEKQP
jgi:preprotein translocase subunit SecA